LKLVQTSGLWRKVPAQAFALAPITSKSVAKMYGENSIKLHKKNNFIAKNKNSRHFLPVKNFIDG
jgi:hypothetical protein